MASDALFDIPQGYEQIAEPAAFDPQGFPRPLAPPSPEVRAKAEKPTREMKPAKDDPRVKLYDLPEGWEEVHPEAPGVIGAAIGGASHGLARGLQAAGQGLGIIGQGDFTGLRPDAPDRSQIGQLLSTPLDKGWTDPAWWSAQMAGGAAETAPALSMGALGGAMGGPVGGALGFGLGALMQALKGSYANARAQGLNHDDATTQAILESGIAGVGGGAAGLAPGASIFGRDAVGALKRPVGEALAQAFGVQPAIMAGQRAASNVVEGQPLGEGVPEAAVMGAAQGVPLMAGHALGHGLPQLDAPQIPAWLREGLTKTIPEPPGPNGFSYSRGGDTPFEPPSNGPAGPGLPPGGGAPAGIPQQEPGPRPAPFNAPLEGGLEYPKPAAPRAPMEGEGYEEKALRRPGNDNAPALPHDKTEPLPPPGIPYNPGETLPTPGIPGPLHGEQPRLPAPDEPQPGAPGGAVEHFSAETGTLGIPRAEMPQIPAQSHGGLVRHLNAQGIAHETTEVNPADLKPTQAEFSPEKVEQAKGDTGARAIIVSNDGHIIDGHHQALAAAQEGKPVKAIVLDAPVDKALEAVKNSPSAQIEGATGTALKSQVETSKVPENPDISAPRSKVRDWTAMRLAELFGHPRRQGHLDMADMILEAARTGQLNDIVRPHNKNSRQVFEEITGTKLPRTVKGTALSLKDGAPFKIAIPRREAIDNARGGVTIQPEHTGGSNAAPRIEENSGIQRLVPHEGAVPQSKRQAVAGLRGERDQGLPEMGGELPSVSGGRGGETERAAHAGSGERERGLRAGERALGAPEGAAAESHEQPQAGIGRRDTDGGRSGGAVRNEPGHAAQQDQAQRNVPRGGRDLSTEGHNHGGVRPEEASQAVGEGPRPATADNLGEAQKGRQPREGAAPSLTPAERLESDTIQAILADPAQRAAVEAVVPEIANVVERPAPAGETAADDQGAEQAGEGNARPGKARGDNGERAEPARAGEDEADRRDHAGANSAAETVRPSVARPPAGTLVEKFRDKFLDSTEPPFRTILEARKFAKENGLEAKEGQTWTKLVDETVEHSLVLAAREIAERGRAAGAGDRATFKRMVALYDRQPNLAVRTSASIAEQAYSTPAPLAYVASRLAGIDGKTTVLEPTAGNGMLLMEADPKKATVNELNPTRARNLDAQGFSPIMADAALPEAFSLQRGKIDVVIANPPFGAVREEGESKVFNVDGFKTTQIDHAIALNALKAMKPDGRAVLIIGGIKADSDAERAKGYMAAAKRRFFYKLMQEYRVSDIFTVSGDLYAKQGAGWPVDVIVIDGKGQSTREPLTKEPPPLLKTWDEVGEKLNVARRVSTPATVSEPSRQPAGKAPAAEPGPAPGYVHGGENAVRGEPVGEPGGPLEPEKLGGEHDRGQPGSVRAGGPVGDGAGSPAATRGERPRADYVPNPERGRPVKANEAGQASYEPASQQGVKLNTLVPQNLRAATEESLDRVQRQHGQIDEYVADALGRAPDELGRYFSAEQIDAIALGISNIEKGDGFIIGDQTGIGKGRVVAAMITYAKKNGMVPVFVTEKPDLYGDMWRDLHDIGWNDQLGRPIEMMMTNAGARVPLDEAAVEWVGEREQAMKENRPIPPRRGQFSPSQTAETASKRMRGLLSGDFAADVVFTTYDQMNSVRGGETERRNFLRAVAPKAFLILDEAHNAGGAGGDPEEAWGDKDKAPPRSEVFREVVDQAKAVMYSSATYAKSPRVMTLFSRTDMAKAVEKPAQLPELIAKGGVPLQQVVSTMLSKSGQYLRRERSFEGVTYEQETVPVDADAYASFTRGLRAVFVFDKGFSEERKLLAQEIAAEMGGGTSKDGGVGETAASSTSFSSIMHNVIGQMVLSIKAEEAGKRAVAAIKAGEKPVIALSKTNESFLKDFIDSSDLKNGDIVDLSFGDLLKRYLERTRRVTLKTGADEKKHVMIPLNMMSGSAIAEYEAAQAALQNLEIGNLPISPIDAIRREIERAGYSVREVTGRAKMLDYSGEKPILMDRPREEQGAAGKRVSVKAFNDGRLDALILNKSGSTGISMHASKGFKDQRKRRMILVEADPNIETHMQMLGRVHRTGQVIPPAYSQLAADIPAETRPTAILMRKMASLNANTTGAKKSKFSSESVDFMNKYGDRVVTQILAEDPNMAWQLGDPVNLDEVQPEAAAKVTGRLTLLEPAQQEELLEKITTAYKALIDQLDAEGTNDLEAKSIDLQARIIESQTVKPATGVSPFQGAVNLDKVSIKSQGRAMAPDEVIEHVKDALGADTAEADFGRALRALQGVGLNKAVARQKTYAERSAAFENMGARVLKDPVAADKFREKQKQLLARWTSVASRAYPGAVVEIGFRGETMPAVVIGLDHKDAGAAKNPIALSTWTLSLALPDSARSLSIPLSQVFTPEFAKKDDQAGLELTGGRTPALDALAEKFEDARKEGRETRYMFSGNLLSAFDQTKGAGQIVNHTMEDGTTRPAILMNRAFKPETFMASRAVRFKKGVQVIDFLSKIPDGEVTSTDGIVTIRRAGAGIEFDLPAAKAQGGRYYADKTVRMVYDNWSKKGTRMRATVGGVKAAELVDALMKIDAVFETTEKQAEAEAIISASK